jgi:hypothetical protein
MLRHRDPILFTPSSSVLTEMPGTSETSKYCQMNELISVTCFKNAVPEMTNWIKNIILLSLSKFYVFRVTCLRYILYFYRSQMAFVRYLPIFVDFVIIHFILGFLIFSFLYLLHYVHPYTRMTKIRQT